jgi:hypothetical protein
LALKLIDPVKMTKVANRPASKMTSLEYELTIGDGEPIDWEAKTAGCIYGQSREHGLDREIYEKMLPGGPNEAYEFGDEENKGQMQDDHEHMAEDMKVGHGIENGDEESYYGDDDEMDESSDFHPSSESDTSSEFDIEESLE